MNGRRDIPAFLNERGLAGVGVEVGVRRGEYSRRIIEEWKCTKLFMIDSFRHLPQMHDVTATWNESKWKQTQRYAHGVASEYPVRLSLLVMTSAEASALFQDEVFDFIHIDANHGYGPGLEWGIRQDLTMPHAIRMARRGSLIGKRMRT
jgi:hypothetical protein